MLWFNTKQNALLYALSILKSGLLDIQGSDNFILEDLCLPDLVILGICSFSGENQL